MLVPEFLVEEQPLMEVPTTVNNKYLLEWGLYNYNKLLECNSDKRAIAALRNGAQNGSDK